MSAVRFSQAAVGSQAQAGYPTASNRWFGQARLARLGKAFAGRVSATLLGPLHALSLPQQSLCKAYSRLGTFTRFFGPQKHIMTASAYLLPPPKKPYASR